MVNQSTRQARIVTVFNQKGGCAKTTTTIQLAGTLGLRGLKVHIIDMDPQNTAALWCLAADEMPFPAESMSLAPLKDKFIDKLDGMAKNYDVIIVDCPPALGSLVPWASLLVSDLAIIPVVPVMDNIWASKQAEELVEAAQQQNQSLKAVYLLSMVRRGKVFEHCRAALQEKARLPILKTQIAMRNAYPESQIFGCVVPMLDAKSQAAEEAEALAAEVADILGLKLKKRK
jgi:chromosome partitioning protein